MNDILSDRNFPLSNYEKYETCRQQSQCYLLIPPPRPPLFPRLMLNNSSSTLINHQQHTNSFLITPSIFIALISVFLLLLFLLCIIFQFYHKLRRCLHGTKHTNVNNNSTSFSKIISTSYNSLIPLTKTTNQSPSTSTITNVLNRSFQHHLPSNSQSFSNNHPANIYEQIRLPTNHNHCSCCFCIEDYYKQQHSIVTRGTTTPYYYTCESSSSSSKIVCQNCLLETLHRKENCFCQNFFIPIK